jgi:hypothetical protein
MPYLQYNILLSLRGGTPKQSIKNMITGLLHFARNDEKNR